MRRTEMAMDSSLTVKPRNAMRDYGRPNTARTDSKSTQSVDASVSQEPVHDGAPAHDTLMHDLVDPESRDMIYREREEREKRRRRAPDDVLQRQRVYNQP